MSPQRDNGIIHVPNFTGACGKEAGIGHSDHKIVRGRCIDYRLSVIFT
jgi:hypothetical protein